MDRLSAERALGQQQHPRSQLLTQTNQTHLFRVLLRLLSTQGEQRDNSTHPLQTRSFWWQIGATMRGNRLFAVVCLTLFFVALLWNGFLHLVVLRSIDESVQNVRRPDFADKAWLSMLLTAGVVCLFAWGYTRFVRDGSVREGVKYGLFFALLAGLLVDLNEYVLLPIPASAPIAWFVGGMFEFALYGVITSAMYGRHVQSSAKI
jgi:hypothetical protein